MRKCRWISAMAAALLIYGQAAAQSTDPVQFQPPAGAGAFTVNPIEEGKALISVSDAAGNPIRGLGPADFTILKSGKRADVYSVQPLETNKEIGLNFVMVVDNSASMRQRNAIEPLLSAMDEVFNLIRPIDQVYLVVFDDRETIRVDGHDLHVRMLQSNNPDSLRTFLSEAFRSRLTDKTVLYEAVLAGLDVVRQLPDEAAKFMVVFSDGEDINSAVKGETVREASSGIENFEAYGVDYMPGPGLDSFLQSFTARNGGRTWKASAATDLVPIFKAVSSTMLYRYVVSYRFPPSGTLAIEPDSLTVEEITTIDSSPMLAHVYFDSGSNEIPPRYVKLTSQSQTAAFTEGDLRGALEKHHHLLNVMGRRMTDHPTASIRLVGCNSNTGEERGRKDLSRLRAESVKAYLQYIWGISPDRITVEARNLPEAPSTNRIEAGREDNRRVEIHSEHPEILDVIQSTYMEARASHEELVLHPMVETEYGLTRWSLLAAGGGEILGSLEGKTDLAGEYLIPLDLSRADRLAATGEISVTLEMEDEAGQLLQLSADPVPVRFIQKEELMARNMGYKVQEKHALILFDFDSAVIKERNQEIVTRIVERIRSLPAATVEITGHTDNIGKDDYNMKLSERRAKAVYDQLIAAYGSAADRIRFSGLGPFNPLYENNMPENRALNRTVTIILEYEAMN
ncbi:MAG: OmpA family protein [Desulfobacterales bacterium]